MRVTNKMIMNNASSNINGTKETVNKRNTQMTSQKKIDRPSDDPVVAVRSLRLSTTLSQVTQYYSKNIPDADQWLDVTETALINMRDIVKDCKELSTKGAQDTNNQDDRKTILTQLESLQKQLYAEGNADYANRTVFTGYRTDSNLTFTEDELKTKYRIDQSISVEAAMEEKRYYSGHVEIPTTEEEVLAPSLNETDSKISDMERTNYYRVRLAYDKIDSVNSLKFKYSDGTEISYEYTEDDDGVFENNLGSSATDAGSGFSFTVYETESEWAEADANGVKKIDENSIVLIRKTGDLIFGEKVAATLKAKSATIDVQYDKTGFEDGQLRPEYYYNCTKMIDETGAKLEKNNTYTKFDSTGKQINFDIEYTIAANQTIAINTEASNVFDSSLQRDLGEMIESVRRTINAYDNLETVKSMMSETQYASDQDQKWLEQWRDAVQKEFDYFFDDMQKLFNTEIGKTTKYYDKISLALTDLGCKGESLSLTKTRVGDQRETVQDLQSKNDDVDLSQIIIDYTAAYTAYQASLTAAGKLSDSTLLNYI